MRVNFLCFHYNTKGKISISFLSTNTHSILEEEEDPQEGGQHIR